MWRGEIWWVDFDPAVGEEIQKVRPAVIVSNNVFNKNLNRLQVVPITTSVDKVYPGEVLVSVNGQSQKAMANQISTVSKLRVSKRMGTILKSDLKRVETAIKFQLGM